MPSGLLPFEVFWVHDPELDQDSPEGLHIPSGLGAQMSGTKWRDGPSIPVSVAMTNSYFVALDIVCVAHRLLQAVCASRMTYELTQCCEQ